MQQSIPTLIQKVEALLPQTQCERCGHPGCRPYAESIVRQSKSIAQCYPGGQETADAIAQLLGRKTETVENQPGPKLLAQIIEADCIGCTKCIQACPVDAIVGASKHMHTVIASECTGCELCIPACPMDCIDMVSTDSPSSVVNQPERIRSQALHAKQRFITRKERLQRVMRDKSQTRHRKTNLDIQAALQASIERAQLKRNQLDERKEKTGNL